MIYGGKEIADYDLWALGDILASLHAAEKRREEASKHVKFNVDREVNSKTIPKMEFPSPNPIFLKLKTEIENAIKNKQGV